MNPRYLAYCAAHGRDPEEMLAFDRERAPGGHMAPYICWINERWQEWNRAHGLGPWTSHDTADHADFDAWLPQQVAGRVAFVRYIAARAAQVGHGAN